MKDVTVLILSFVMSMSVTLRTIRKQPYYLSDLPINIFFFHKYVNTCRTYTHLYGTFQHSLVCQIYLIIVNYWITSSQWWYNSFARIHLKVAITKIWL